MYGRDVCLVMMGWTRLWDEWMSSEETEEKVE